MELNGNMLAVAGLIATILIVEMRLLRRELKIYFGALMERNRRRNRRESGAPPLRRRAPDRDDAAPEAWSDDDTTDLHELVELEREQQRRPRRRPGERAPTRGTHHDR